MGQGGAGLSVFANVNAAKGHEKGDGTNWTETTLDSGGKVSLHSGQETALTGAQVSGNHVKVDIGRNLTITSLQNSSNYDSKQSSISAGGSFTFGTMTGSGYINFSQDKMHSVFDSVAEQSGIFAGADGYDITVGRHTQLNGGAIGSTATADKNSLDTGTLGYSDITNKADYKVSHSGGGFSSSGNLGAQAALSAASTLMSSAGSSGHAQGTTQAAVSDGTIKVRDMANQQQDISGLLRDVTQANDAISPIFNKEKEQNRLQVVQMVSDIGNQVADIVRTQSDIDGLKAAIAKSGVSLQGLSEKERLEKLAQLRNTPEYKKATESTGTGSDVQRAITAATAAVSGLASGNFNAALAGAAAPYIANEIGKNITEKNTMAGIMAHAVVNAVLAKVQGQDALVGAAGAAVGEATGILLAQQVYGKTLSQLTEAEKQTISALSTLASGLAGGLIGDSTQTATAAANAEKTTVENNYLSSTQALDFYKELSDCRKSNNDCQKIIDNWEKISDEQSAVVDERLEKQPLTTVGWDKEVAQGGIDMTERPDWMGDIGADIMTSDEAKAYVQLWNGQDLAKIDVNSPQWMKYAVFASDPENQAMLVSGGLLVKDITKAAISFMSRNTAAATVKASEVGMQWSQGNMKQGMPWEDYIGKSFPADARLPSKFKTFDYYDGTTKTAVSVKSLDTQTLSRLSKPNQLYSSMKGNIDAAAKFKGYTLSGETLTPAMIAQKEIQLAVPATTNKIQWAEINRAIEYGKTQGVKVTVTQVK